MKRIRLTQRSRHVPPARWSIATPTPRSPDGHASFEDNVRAAAAAGCRVMVSTDHLTLPASMDANCEVQVVEERLAGTSSGL